ncbi:hypothetical protein AM587_10015604 [Phytophthora nicotianae]|uniref:Uncharacterized protein n=1 Tax=Phytophthora nicotianae TaxID=4792 RepID=A0A0W8CDH4_PHYNI|nr:hypothetical protein AM587_10015604 [Phytophthora nicotianae]
MRSANSQENAQPESATFVLNGQAYAKWYYHWGSGANKVQRATKHVLKAYVFYQTRAQTQQGSFHQDQARDGTLALMCVVTSPPFTVVSYRRAPLDVSTGLVGSRSDATASTVPHYATDTSHPVDPRLRSLVQHQISRAFQEYNQQQQRGSRSGSSDEPLRLLDDQDENRARSDVRGPFGRYRQLQEREGLRFRLLTPDDAALSASSLHSQIQTRGPRLVFDSITKCSNDHPHWRDAIQDDDDAFINNDNEDDTRDEAVPKPLAPSWIAQAASASEVKASGPVHVGMPPSTTYPGSHAEKAGSVALRRFKQQQQQLETHQRELQQLTDLAIVHYFASRVMTNDAASLANLEIVFTITISQHWQYASNGATLLARLLLSIAKSGRTQASSVARSNPERDQLMLAMAEVCVWAFSPENIELVQSLLAACHPLLLENVNSRGSVVDGAELREAYLDSAGRCWSALDRFLQTPRATQTTIRSVRRLSDAVLGVVYSDPELEGLRSGLRSMLQRPTIVLEDSKENVPAGSDANDSVIPRCNLAGWQSFVAQVREVYLMQAEPSVLSRQNAWLRLICDGRVRVAPVTPNGLTSLLGGASCGFGGDYVAYRLEQQEPSNYSICLEFYWWPVGKTPSDRVIAFRSTMTLKTTTNGAFLEVRLNLERGIVDHQTVVAAEFPELELWSPTERVQAVDIWEPWISIEGVYARK